MKRLISCLLTLLILLFLCACGSSSNDASDSKITQNITGEAKTSEIEENDETEISKEALLTGIWTSIDTGYMESYHSPDIYFIVLTTDGYFFYEMADLGETSYINEILDTFENCPTSQDLVDFVHRVGDVVITSVDDLFNTGTAFPYQIIDGRIRITDEDGEVEELIYDSNYTSIYFESDGKCFNKYTSGLASLSYFIGNWTVNYYDTSYDRETFESTEYMLSLNDDLTYVSTSGDPKDTWSYMNGKFELSPHYIIDQPDPSTRSITGETFVLSDNMFIVYLPYTYKNGMTHYYLWTFERTV